MFGVLLTPVWLVFIIAGISLLSVSYSSTDVLNSVCSSTDTNESESQVLKLLKQYQVEVDEVVQVVVNQNMC